MGKWSDIRPSMMSNEEETDGRFKVHRQEWRSAEFNDFMDELDDHAIASQGKPRPRITRYYGIPCKVAPPPPPADVSHWMVSFTDPEVSDILAPNSPQML